MIELLYNTAQSSGFLRSELLFAVSFAAMQQVAL
jgi:hypothetical protein